METVKSKIPKGMEGATCCHTEAKLVVGTGWAGEGKEEERVEGLLLISQVVRGVKKTPQKGV